MARREKARLAVEPRYLRASQRAKERVVGLARNEFSFLWLIALAFFPLLQPWITIRGLDVFEGGGERSSNFIEVLWQVQGAALGLSLAVVLFAFQSVHSHRLGGSLRAFAEETWLFPIFYTGLIGLVLDGVVLLSFVQDASDGWAPSWAVIWAAGTAFALGLLFVLTIRAVDPRALHGIRLRRAQRAIRQEIEDVIFRRVALVILDGFCKTNGVEYASIFGQSPPASALIRAKRHGEVRDVRLRQLMRDATAAAEGGFSKPIVRVEIGSVVRQGTELAAVDAAQATSSSKLGRSFRIRGRRRDVLRPILQDLHDEALVAIRTPSPAAYSTITELYERVFLVLPETWARYGQQYISSVAGGLGPFELTVQDHLERQLYEEMTQAARSGSRDIAHDALDLPIVVALQALDLKAIGLIKRMVGLWVAARHKLLSDADDEDVRNLLEWSWLRMSEFAMRPEMLITESHPTPESQQLGKDVLLQIWDGYATICKGILDARPLDTELLRQINEVWDQPLRHWEPKYDYPREWHLKIAIERGEPPEVVRRIRAELEENQRRINMKREIVDWRELQRLGLLFWIMRSVRERGDAERWKPAWEVFSVYFDDVAYLSRILAKGLEADWESRGPWSNWVLETLPRYEAHYLAVDVELIHTFVVLALSLTSPDGLPPQIEPLQSGLARLENPSATVRGLIEIVNLKQLLPSDRIEERAELLANAIERMQTTQRETEEQALIDAPLDDDLVQTFSEKLRGAWRASRTLRSAFAATGAIEVVEGQFGEASGSQVARWLPKGLFTREQQVSGLDHSAEEYGRNLAHWEWDALLREADHSPLSTAATGASPAECLRATITELGEAGYAPSLVIVSTDWQTYEALELTPAPDRGGDAVSPSWLEGEDGRASFIGSVDGLHVFEDHSVPDRRLYVFDLQHFARFRELNVEDPPGPVRVKVTLYDENGIREMVREDRVNFREELDDERKIRALQQKVHLNAVYPFQIEVLDADAARRIDLVDAISED